jgi:IS5 family transposase
MRFIGLGLEDAVPDATTLWLYREALARAGPEEELYAAFDGNLRAHGLLAMGDTSVAEAQRIVRTPLHNG